MGPEILAVLGTVGKVAATGASLYGAYSSYEAGQDAAKMADKETAENIRRANAEDRAKNAENRARIAASGVQFTGSPGLFLKEQQDEQSRQKSWMKKAGDYRADALKDEGTSSAVGKLAKIPGYWT